MFSVDFTSSGSLTLDEPDLPLVGPLVLDLLLLGVVLPFDLLTVFVLLLVFGVSSSYLDFSAVVAAVSEDLLLVFLLDLLSFGVEPFVLLDEVTPPALFSHILILIKTANIGYTVIFKHMIKRKKHTSWLNLCSFLETWQDLFLIFSSCFWSIRSIIKNTSMRSNGQKHNKSSK